MERCVELLVKNGITDICATLRYNPGPIMDYFGDGERFGVDITWRVETQPLGTAGSVKACIDVLGDAPFLVMSGDAACDFDIAALAREHAVSYTHLDVYKRQTLLFFSGPISTLRMASSIS